MIAFTIAQHRSRRSLFATSRGFRPRELDEEAPTSVGVLEIGCGTGQLTRALLARGVRVTAVEPAVQLIARAGDQLAGAREVA
jgi:16S rRNA A1518/A1519 N6-dimethyltransferase RsmA/KsgA/DIM1 with predicted DNA glycosylase/AP lyase activity